MKIVILCGGYGTRIRDVADNIPKPMIPVGGLPILWHIMKYYAHWGHTDFILCLGYKGETIKDFFLNYKAYTSDYTISLGQSSLNAITYHNQHAESNWKVTLADTGLNTMTGARIKRIEKYLDNEPFMLTYGDGLSDVNVTELIQFHQKNHRSLTVTGVRPPGRFGELVGDSDGKVIEFNEKPQSTAGLISGGFFVCNRDIFNYLPDQDTLVFEKEPIQSMVRAEQMSVFPHKGFWQPMDTYRDYIYLNQLVDQNKAPWIKW